MNIQSSFASRCLRARQLAWTATAALVGGCGGGGGSSDNDGGYFAVVGAQSLGGVPVTVCVDNAEFTDPASVKGMEIAAALAKYYGIVGGYRSYGGTGQGCRERFATVDHLLSVADYNSKVAGAGSPPPAPGAGPVSPPPASPPPSSPPPVLPPTAQPPVPPPITCPSHGGAGTNGLELYGQTSYASIPLTGNTSGTLSFDPGEVKYRDPNLAANATTGSLRAQLWAVESSYAGGAISGYVVAAYNIRFTDGSNQLRNGESANLSTQLLNARTPPRGAYCMVVTLEQYHSSCATADRFCIADWQQYGNSQNFQ